MIKIDYTYDLTDEDTCDDVSSQEYGEWGELGDMGCESFYEEEFDGRVSDREQFEEDEEDIKNKEKVFWQDQIKENWSDEEIDSLKKMRAERKEKKMKRRDNQIKKELIKKDKELTDVRRGIVKEFCAKYGFIPSEIAPTLKEQYEEVIYQRKMMVQRLRDNIRKMREAPKEEVKPKPFVVSPPPPAPKEPTVSKPIQKEPEQSESEKEPIVLILNPHRKRLPEYPTMSDNKDMHKKKYKTNLCRSVMRGERCTYGERCIFAHNAKELILNRTKLCESFFRNQACKNSDCDSYHNPEACRYGERCKFIKRISATRYKSIGSDNSECLYIHPNESIDSYRTRILKYKETITNKLGGKPKCEGDKKEKKVVVRREGYSARKAPWSK